MVDSSSDELSLDVVVVCCRRRLLRREVCGPKCERLRRLCFGWLRFGEAGLAFLEPSECTWRWKMVRSRQSFQQHLAE